MQVRVIRIKYPFHHGPGHHRETGEEVNRALPRLAGKTWNLVVRIWNNLRAHRKHAHVQAVDVVMPVGIKRHALLCGGVFHPLGNQSLGFGVQGQLGAQRSSCALACMVVWRGTNAAA